MSISEDQMHIDLAALRGMIEKLQTESMCKDFKIKELETELNNVKYMFEQLKIKINTAGGC